MDLLSAIFYGFIAALVSYVVCCRNNYISTITSERTKWLTKLREDCSLLICQLKNTNKIKSLKSNIQHRVDLECQCYRVILQLTSKDDEEIIKKILKVKNVVLNSDEDCEKLIEELLFEIRNVLKNTWEEIKDEARPWYLNVLIILRKCICHCDKTDKSS